MQNLPTHLKKYVVEQNYEKYTPLDQAIWRYILRQLKSFLSHHAHESYCEGLINTGVETEQIPRIENISKKLEKFGWRAIPVSGFIPPAAFMELQSLSVLPIASDLRTLDHLEYTPAPDIVHEAAGHAPLLANSEFSNYLKKYSQVAKKAIISKEDLDLYEAIRTLSDVKENPNSLPENIELAEKNLDFVVKNISHVSEASELSRMNWWTAEYGLFGSLENPKIIGAGLLSSVGESEWCLSQNVKKIPLSVDCLKYSYDITKPQPQLFVASDFNHLVTVLDEMAQQMAFKQGGAKGLDKAIKSKTVNTWELNSGLQVSGLIEKYFVDKNDEIIFVKSIGPCQLCLNEKEIAGHDKEYHQHGFSSPIGPVKELGNQCPSNLSNSDMESKFPVGSTIKWTYLSGISLTGEISGWSLHNNQLALLSLKNATVAWGNQVLYSPDWGPFDLAIGSKIVSVFGGPADRLAYGEIEDFVAARVPVPNYSVETKKKFQLYQDVRNLREKNIQDIRLFEDLQNIKKELQQFNLMDEWLLLLEIHELSYTGFKSAADPSLKDKFEKITEKTLSELQKIAQADNSKKKLIENGLKM